MNNLTLEQHLHFCDKYLITPNELLLLEIILLHQEGDAPEIVYNYFNANTDARGMVRSMLERLQHVGIITKSYKIPEKGGRLDLDDITLNKVKVKDFYKCSYDLGIELWETYPQFGLINGVTVGLRTIADKDNDITDFYRRYGKEIGWNPEKHQHIIDLIKWANENNIINCSIAKFVKNHKWEELEALKNGENGSNINYNAMRLL